MSRVNDDDENKEDTSSHSKASSLHKEMTMSERQMIHPLEREDPIAYKFIQFVR